MPADIKAVAAGPTSILVAWRAPLHTNGILTKYTVRMQDLTDTRVSMHAAMILFVMIDQCIFHMYTFQAIDLNSAECFD